MTQIDPALVTLIKDTVRETLAEAARGVPRRYLSTEDAAAYLGTVSPKTLANWRSLGIGPKFARIGGRVAYAFGDLDAFIAQAMEAKS